MSSVKLNHDYPTPGNLIYRTPAGDPIVGAVVRVFTKTDYEGLADPIGVTTTDATGRWISPVYVTAGARYAVVFQCDQQYGPDCVVLDI